MNKQKGLAAILAAFMAFSVVPSMAFAQDGDVAQIGGTFYPSLQEAVDAVPADGTETTVTLLDNIVMSTDDIVTIPSGRNIRLDMAKKSITVESDFEGRPIVNEGTLTVTGNGTIDSEMSADGGFGAINNKGTLTIENGTYRGAIYASGSCIRNTGSDAMLTVKDGTFEKATCAIYNEGTAVLNGGTYTGETCSSCNSQIWSYTIRNVTEASKMTINGGTYTGVQGAVSASIGYLEVNGGTFKTVKCVNNPKHTATFYALYAAGEVGKVKCVINDGTFITEGSYTAVLIGNDNDGGIHEQATGIINGGTFIAPEGVPALKGAEKTGDPQIYGGTFSTSVVKYAADEVQYELQGDGTYSYYKTLDAAMEHAGDGATILPTDKDSSGNTVTVKFDYNNGDDSTVVSVNAAGGKITLPVITREGFALAGWSDGTAVHTAGVEVSVTSGSSFTAVWNVLVSGVTLDKSELTLKENEKATLTATISPADAADKTVSWSSDDETVAKVDANGGITAIGAGTATITVNASNGKSAACKVTITHSAVKTPAKAPTATEDGNIDFWYCAECGRYFSDEMLTKEIKKEDTVILATGTTTSSTSEPSKTTSSGPSQATTSTVETATTTISTPETGESTNSMIWTVLLVLAGGGLFGTALFAKKSGLARRK